MLSVVGKRPIKQLIIPCNIPIPNTKETILLDISNERLKTTLFTYQTRTNHASTAAAAKLTTPQYFPPPYP